MIGEFGERFIVVFDINFIESDGEDFDSVKFCERLNTLPFFGFEGTFTRKGCEVGISLPSVYLRFKSFRDESVFNSFWEFDWTCSSLSVEEETEIMEFNRLRLCLLLWGADDLTSAVTRSLCFNNLSKPHGLSSLCNERDGERDGRGEEADELRDGIL